MCPLNNFSYIGMEFVKIDVELQTDHLFPLWRDYSFSLKDVFFSFWVSTSLSGSLMVQVHIIQSFVDPEIVG